MVPTIVPSRVSAFERPQSASNTDKKKVVKAVGGLVTKEELVGGMRKSGMGRYPSPMVNKEVDTNLMVSSTQYKDKWRGL